MSVVVKGMQIPENCWECIETDLNIVVSVFGGMCPYCEKIRTDHEMKTGRHPECPLVALPDKHGDLIDRDALKEDLRMGKECDKDCPTDWKTCHYDRVYAKLDFCEWIDGSDTIVEAEDSECQNT